MSEQNVEGNGQKGKGNEQFLLDTKQEEEGSKQTQELSEAEKAKVNQEIEKQRKAAVKAYKAQSELLEEKIRYMENVIHHHELAKDYNKIVKEQQQEDETGEEPG